MAIELPQTFCAIEDDGFYRIDIHKQFLGKQVELVKSLSKFAPRIIPGILSSNEVLAVTASGLSAARRLYELALHTYFRPMVDVSEKVALVPVWKQGMPKAQEMKLTWIAPANMALYVVLYWECGSKDVNSIAPVPYLVALAENKRTYLLPMPNLYGDGRICLGRASEISWRTLGGMVPQLNKVTEILQKTSWNSDLLRDVGQHANAMFRFDSDEKQMAPPDQWWVHCQVINLAPYEFLGKLGT